MGQLTRLIFIITGTWIFVLGIDNAEVADFSAPLQRSKRLYNTITFIILIVITQHNAHITEFRKKKLFDNKNLTVKKGLWGLKKVMISIFWPSLLFL